MVSGALTQKFIKFSAVGAVCTLLQYVFLIVGVEVFSASVPVSSTVGFIVSAALNYLLNYHFTFHSNRSHLLAASKFIVVAAVGVALNYVFITLLATHLHVPYIAAQVATTAAVLVWTFLANAHWSFDSRVVREERQP